MFALAQIAIDNWETLYVLMLICWAYGLHCIIRAKARNKSPTCKQRHERTNNPCEGCEYLGITGVCINCENYNPNA